MIAFRIDMKGGRYWRIGDLGITFASSSPETLNPWLAKLGMGV